MISTYRAKLARTLPSGKVDRNYVSITLTASNGDQAQGKALEQAHELYARTGLEHRVVRVETGS